MIFPVFAIPFAATLLVASPGGVPSFDVTPSCRAATTGKDAIRRDIKSCLDSEQNARDQVAKGWSTFPAADRTRCIREATMVGGATYTQLLTCLELARDVRNMRRDNAVTSKKKI